MVTANVPPNNSTVNEPQRHGNPNRTVHKPRSARSASGGNGSSGRGVPDGQIAPAAGGSSQPPLPRVPDADDPKRVRACPSYLVVRAMPGIPIRVRVWARSDERTPS